MGHNCALLVIQYCSSEKNPQGCGKKIRGVYLCSHSWALADQSVIGASGQSDDDGSKNDRLKWKLAESVR